MAAHHRWQRGIKTDAKAAGGRVRGQVREHPDLPIIALTALATIDIREACLRAGMNG